MYNCLRYASGWVYDDGNGNENSFIPADSDILVADVSFGTTAVVTSLAGTDEYYQYVTKGFNSGDLTFSANKYGSASTTSAGDVFIGGSYIISQSIDTVAYPDVVATASSTPSQFSTGTQLIDYYQFENSDQPEIRMQVKTYYTDADSTLWKVFDGDFSSATQVQEPDLLWEGEQQESKIQSVA